MSILHIKKTTISNGLEEEDTEKEVNEEVEGSVHRQECTDEAVKWSFQSQPNSRRS